MHFPIIRKQQPLGFRKSKHLYGSVNLVGNFFNLVGRAPFSVMSPLKIIFYNQVVKIELQSINLPSRLLITYGVSNSSPGRSGPARSADCSDDMIRRSIDISVSPLELST